MTAFAVVLTVIIGIFKVIGGLIAMFSDNSGVDVDGDHNKNVVRSVAYKKIKEITASPDKNYITVKRNAGNIKLLVEPHQCDFIENELRLRVKKVQ